MGCAGGSGICDRCSRNGFFFCVNCARNSTQLV
nr:MAG TPA: Protein PML, B box, TRIM19, METAL [Caudoviricetes sp.]